MQKDTVESLRVKCGLSRPHLAMLLDGVSGDEARLARMQEIRLRHRAFVKRVQERVDEEEPRIVTSDDGEHVPCLTAKEVSRATGLGEFHVAQLRQRGKLAFVRQRGMTYYPVADVRELVDRPLKPRDHFSPFADDFISYLYKSMPEIRESMVPAKTASVV